VPPRARCQLVRADADLTPALLADATRLLADLVAHGAALGWVEPPSAAEVTALLREVVVAAGRRDAALVVAATGEELHGLGWWRRYSRPTHRVHADLERVAVRSDAQGAGLGRALTAMLVEEARAAGIEQLTLDLRGDNAAALQLYESLGFRVYGRLPEFVAVGRHRFEKVFCVLDLRTGAAGEAPWSHGGTAHPR
jgi:ribosomal protein S18 acetylase RimI-like enzyme